MPRNYDPALHPLETPREYTRALNAVKLERVFAKPFVGCLDGHRDGVTCLGKHPRHLSWLYSGSCDGEVGDPAPFPLVFQSSLPQIDSTSRHRKPSNRPLTY